jgi:uncharacterized RDD family membrane protein YckC
MTRPIADLGRRWLARLVDSLVLLAFSGLLVVLFGYSPIAVLVAVAANIAYEVYFVSTSGQTPGKRLLGIAVSDADGDLLPTPGQALRRTAPAFVAALPAIGPVALVFYAPVLWQPRRQGLHDQLARTVVVRAVPEKDGGLGDER